MQKEQEKFLNDLIETPSPSGYESPAAKVYRDYIKKYSDEVITDVMGNTTAVLNKDGNPKIMLAGHIDEIGLIVQNIDDCGYIYAREIGGIDPSVFPGKRVKIYAEKGQILGVIGRIAAHMQEKEEQGRASKITDLWIDFGAKDKKEAQKLVRIGDPITIDYGMDKLLGDRYVSRAFDDKIGVFVVAEVMRLLKDKKINACVYGTATTQEETGLRGSRTAAFALKPELGIAIDVTHSMDSPGCNKNKYGNMELGKGPVVMRGASVNPVVEKMLFETAKKAKIEVQTEAGGNGSGTDAFLMQMTGAGMATGLVSIPLRYMHTPIEVLSMKDVEDAAKLIAAFIEGLKPNTDFRP
jgi:endoglucanase